jgi:hypothetical protein
MLRLWLWTTDPVCARLDSPEMTPLVPSSPPLSAVLATRYKNSSQTSNNKSGIGNFTPSVEQKKKPILIFKESGFFWKEETNIKKSIPTS